LTNYFFTQSQIDEIREGAISILSEIGVKLRPELIEKLKAKGFKTDASGAFIFIEKQMSRAKIESQKNDSIPSTEKRRLTTYTSAYSHTYENLDGSFEKITTDSNIKMAQFMANLGKEHTNLGVGPPGHPQDVHPELQFFRQAVNGFVWCENFWPMEPTSLKAAPYYFELCEAMGKPVSGLPIYVASPLNISGESLDISLAFAHKLKDVSFNSMPSFGANTPLNMVAAYAQTVAETVGGAILFEELTGVKTYFSTNIFPFDFYDMSMAFGTPEKLLTEWTNMEVACRISGGEFKAAWHCDIHTMALRSGIQASVEKASLATAGAMRGASSFGCSGTISMDEVFSPVQLLLDLEMIDHVQKIVDGMPADDFDGNLLDEVREGLKNSYIMSDRSLDNMRDYVWQSKLFTRKTHGAYTSKPFPLDVEKAKLKIEAVMSRPPCWKLDDKLEAEAERIYKKALEIIK
jgi:trimethylamine:corrinoid methyltransferase-like protein